MTECVTHSESDLLGGEKLALDEESEQFKVIKEAWGREAKECESVDTFIEMLSNYEHDYGTIVWAAASAMMAAFHKINNGKQGGLSGFQASALAWIIFNKFGFEDPVGMRVLGYSELCFPQNENHFTTIPHDVWEKLKDFAHSQLEGHGPYMTVSTRSRMIDIVQGKPPYGMVVGERAKEVSPEEVDSGTV